MADENEKKEKGEKTLTVRFPISIKLVLIVSILIIISLGSITYLVNFFVSDDVRITAENTNFDANTRSANVVKNTITQMRSNALLLLDVIANSSGSDYVTRSSSSLYFDRNPDIAAIVLLSQNNFKRGDFDLRLVNNKFFAQNELDEDQIEVFVSTEREAIEGSFGKEVTVLNATPFFNFGTIALVLPWNGLGRDDAVVIIASCESLTSSFGGGSASTSFVINNRGDVLIHPDFETMQLNANFSDSPLVVQMRKNNDENRQILYTDADGKEYFGAYQKLELGDLGVLTTVQSELIFENVRATTKRNIYLTLAVLFVSIIFVWFWSLSLSHPLKKLTAASAQIEAGDYDVRLKARSHDEIGVLTQSFGRMSAGLAERERLKDTFGRFINKDIAEKAARGELALGGETKTCTVARYSLATSVPLRRLAKNCSRLKSLNF